MWLYAFALFGVCYAVMRLAEAVAARGRQELRQAATGSSSDEEDVLGPSRSRRRRRVGNDPHNHGNNYSYSAEPLQPQTSKPHYEQTPSLRGAEQPQLSSSSALPHQPSTTPKPSSATWQPHASTPSAVPPKPNTSVVAPQPNTSVVQSQPNPSVVQPPLPQQARPSLNLFDDTDTDDDLFGANSASRVGPNNSKPHLTANVLPRSNTSAILEAHSVAKVPGSIKALDNQEASLVEQSDERPLPAARSRVPPGGVNMFSSAITASINQAASRQNTAQLIDSEATRPAVSKIPSQCIQRKVAKVQSEITVQAPVNRVMSKPSALGLFDDDSEEDLFAGVIGSGQNSKLESKAAPHLDASTQKSNKDKSGTNVNFKLFSSDDDDLFGGASSKASKAHLTVIPGKPQKHESVTSHFRTDYKNRTEITKTVVTSDSDNDLFTSLLASNSKHENSTVEVNKRKSAIGSDVAINSSVSYPPLSRLITEQAEQVSAQKQVTSSCFRMPTKSLFSSGSDDDLFAQIKPAVVPPSSSEEKPVGSLCKSNVAKAEVLSSDRLKSNMTKNPDCTSTICNTRAAEFLVTNVEQETIVSKKSASSLFGSESEEDIFKEIQKITSPHFNSKVQFLPASKKYNSFSQTSSETIRKTETNTLLSSDEICNVSRLDSAQKAHFQLFRETSIPNNVAVTRTTTGSNVSDSVEPTEHKQGFKPHSDDSLIKPETEVLAQSGHIESAPVVFVGGDEPSLKSESMENKFLEDQQMVNHPGRHDFEAVKEVKKSSQCFVTSAQVDVFHQVKSLHIATVDGLSQSTGLVSQVNTDGVDGQREHLIVNKHEIACQEDFKAERSNISVDSLPVEMVVESEESVDCKKSVDAKESVDSKDSAPTRKPPPGGVAVFGGAELLAKLGARRQTLQAEHVVSSVYSSSSSKTVTNDAVRVLSGVVEQGDHDDRNTAVDTNLNQIKSSPPLNTTLVRSLDEASINLKRNATGNGLSTENQKPTVLRKPQFERKLEGSHSKKSLPKPMIIPTASSMTNGKFEVSDSNLLTTGEKPAIPCRPRAGKVKSRYLDNDRSPSFDKDESCIGIPCSKFQPASNVSAIVSGLESTSPRFGSSFPKFSPTKSPVGTPPFASSFPNHSPIKHKPVSTVHTAPGSESASPSAGGSFPKFSPRKPVGGVAMFNSAELLARLKRNKVDASSSEEEGNESKDLDGGMKSPKEGNAEESHRPMPRHQTGSFGFGSITSATKITSVVAAESSVSFDQPANTQTLSNLNKARPKLGPQRRPPTRGRRTDVTDSSTHGSQGISDNSKSSTHFTEHISDTSELRTSVSIDSLSSNFASDNQSNSNQGLVKATAVESRQLSSAVFCNNSVLSQVVGENVCDTIGTQKTLGLETSSNNSKIQSVNEYINLGNSGSVKVDTQVLKSSGVESCGTRADSGLGSLKSETSSPNLSSDCKFGQTSTSSSVDAQTRMQKVLTEKVGSMFLSSDDDCDIFSSKLVPATVKSDSLKETFSVPTTNISSHSVESSGLFSETKSFTINSNSSRKATAQKELLDSDDLYSGGLPAQIDAPLQVGAKQPALALTNDRFAHDGNANLEPIVSSTKTGISVQSVTKTSAKSSASLFDDESDSDDLFGDVNSNAPSGRSNATETVRTTEEAVKNPCKPPVTDPNATSDVTSPSTTFTDPLLHLL